MRTILLSTAILMTAMTSSIHAAPATGVRTAAGVVEGEKLATGVYTFKGVPFAAAPVGPLRWKAPQPVAKWSGVRPAREFGARCMQTRVFDDMVFRDEEASEDCLYLNVWTPAPSKSEKRPVMVWIYGGGFTAGATSEPRQDGENLAKKGVVLVSMNYRLNIFGFFSHPELAAESGHNSAGNYGLMDQLAALQWVKANIAAFGGDPGNVTIFGESAGSFSVCAQMASPLARVLFHRAIGESGSFLNTAVLPAKPLAESMKADAKFAESIGAPTLEALRAKPAAELLAAAMKPGATTRFAPNIDGYFLPRDPGAVFADGQQNHVPLLAGWNGQEGFLSDPKPTPESFAAQLHKQFGDKAGEMLKLYPAATPEEAMRSTLDLSGDMFIAFSTWKWLEAHRKTGQSPVYRYRFDQAPPPPVGTPPDSPQAQRGAYHSAEIEFVFNVLPSKNLPWRPEDQKVSDLVSSYWVNFAKSGDPNGAGLPKWPAFTDSNREVMQFLNGASAMPEPHRERYEFLDSMGHK